MKKIIFIVIKALVLVTLIIELIKGNFSNAFLYALIEVLFLLADKVLDYLKVSFLLQLLIYIFIFGTVILGNIFHFYIKFTYFDNIMHYLSGVILGGLAYYLANKIQKLDNKLLLLFIFSFSMGSAAIWEITEYTSDNLFKTDMQKDTIVTEITSAMYDKEEKVPITKKIDNLIVSGEDYIEKYGGYIDIGLIDTMTDIIMGLLGCTTYVVYLLIKKKLII